MNEYYSDYVGDSGITSVDGTIDFDETNVGLDDDLVVVESISADNLVTSSTDENNLNSLDEKVDYIRGNRIIVRRFILKK